MAGTSPAMTKSESFSDGWKGSENTACIFSHTLRSALWKLALLQLSRKSGAREKRLKPRQRRHVDIDRALGHRDHAQRPGIEGDVGKPQAGDFCRHPHAILVLLEIRYRGGDLI